MLTLKRVSVVLALMMTAVPVWSMDQNNEFRTIGIGAQPCSAYLQARQGNDPDASAPYGVWMTGFITANNLTRRHTYDLLGNTTVERAMDVLDSYCGDHPEHPFVFAVMQLVSKELVPQRVQKKPESAPAPIPIPSPEH